MTLDFFNAADSNSATLPKGWLEVVFPLRSDDRVQESRNCVGRLSLSCHNIRLDGMR